MAKAKEEKTPTELMTISPSESSDSSTLVEITTYIRADQAFALEILENAERHRLGKDFDKAKLFLEALGYQKLFVYEKYRTTYEFGNCHIMLDEMPYGNFVEIEGEDSAAIHNIANKLKLDLKASIPASYSALFERVHSTMGFTFTDLTFANFAGLTVTPEHLQVQPADK